MTSEATALWFVVSGLVPTFKVTVAFGHWKLIFTVWPSQQGPRAQQGASATSRKLECSGDKHFKTSLHHTNGLMGLFNIHSLT